MSATSFASNLAQVPFPGVAASMARLWRSFSLLEQYSKFSRRLSALSAFLWFTSRPIGSPRNARATSRCTQCEVRLPSLQRVTPKYLARRCGFKRTPARLFVLLRALLTSPLLLTSYKPSYPGIARHSVISIAPKRGDELYRTHAVHGGPKGFREIAQ